PGRNQQQRAKLQPPKPQRHARSRTEIARVAQGLWQQAGRPPGRYIELWTKVEQALTARPNPQDGAFQDVGPASDGASPELPQRASPGRAVPLTKWRPTAWEHPIMSGKNGSKRT